MIHLTDHDFEPMLVKVRDMVTGQTISSEELVQYLIELDRNIEDNDFILDFATRFETYVLKSLPIKKFNIGEGEISRMTVDDYSQLYQQSAWCPPVLYDRMEGLVDGYHRVSAIKRVGGEKVPAFIGKE